MSKSTNIYQSGTHRATGEPTLQRRPPHTVSARKALPNERLEGAAGASPPSTSATLVPNQPSRRRDHHRTDNESIAIPSGASTGHRATAERRDTSQFNVEPDVQSRAGQSIAAYSMPSSNLSTSKVARAAQPPQHEGVTSPGPSWSASSMQLPSQLHPVTNSPSRNVLPSRALQETGSNTPSRSFVPEERRERNEPPYPQVDTRNERTGIRTYAAQGDRTAPVLPSAKPYTTYPPPSATEPSTTYLPPSATKPSTTYPTPSAELSAPSPPPLKRPSASTSLLSAPAGTPHSNDLIQRPSVFTSPPAPSLAKSASSQMNTPRGAHPSDPHWQAPSRGATFESPHPPSADRGLVRSRVDEQRRKDPSAQSHRPPATLEYTPPTTEPSWQGYKDPFATPHIAPIHPEGPEHFPTTAERPLHQDRRDPFAASHRPPVPITGYQRAPAEGSVQRADPSYGGRGHDSSASHLPDMARTRRKIGQSSITAPPLDRRETHNIPPAASVSQNQPKHLIRETSISHTNSTTSSANLWSQPPNFQADSRTHLTSAQQPSATGYASSNLERGRGPQLQVERNFPESQHPTEHLATTGTSFSHQQGHSIKQAHSSQNFLSPGVIEYHRRTSISSTGTSSEGQFPGQPIPLELLNPLSPENRRGERDRERANAPPRGRSEDEMPPPGLRNNDTQSPEIRGGCLCFR